MSNFMKYIAYSAGALFILMGLAIIFSNITPGYLPSHFKVIFGVVLFLYGIYRIVVTIFKQRRPDEDD